MAIVNLPAIRATAGLPFTYSIAYNSNQVSLQSITGLPQKLEYEESDGKITISGVPVILGDFKVTITFSDGTEYSFRILVTR